MVVASPDSRPHAELGRTTHLLVQLLLVAGGSVLLGAATSWAQTLLPDALVPLANSASGWTALTAVAVAACRARTGASALYGATSFVALALGYQVMSTVRGFPTSETLFLVVGALVGPVVGIAAAWLRRGGVRAAIGCGVLAGIAVGEAAYGLVLVSASTGWFSWALIGGAGLALLVATVVRGARAPRDFVFAIGLAGVVAVAFFLAYTLLGTVAL